MEKSEKIMELYESLAEALLSDFTEEDRFNIYDVKMMILGAVTKTYYEAAANAESPC